jgi:hypothetical protein
MAHYADSGDKASALTRLSNLSGGKWSAKVALYEVSRLFANAIPRFLFPTNTSYLLSQELNVVLAVERTGTLIDGQHISSTLSFAGFPEQPDLECLDQFARVREPVRRSRAGVKAKLADVFFGRSRHAESLNELKAFRVLIATGRPDSWLEQPFLLDYHVCGSKHRYTPDALVIWGSYKEAVEIKEDSEADLPENQSRFNLIRGLLADHDYHFRVWKSSEICGEPRLSNASLLLRYRSVRVAAAEHERIQLAISSRPDVRLSMFRDSPMTVRSVLRLVLDGTLHVDWWKPIDFHA